MAERPPELIYAVDERPPPGRLLLLGLQHALLMCVYLVLIPIVARAAGASHAVMLDMVALGMLGLAIGAALQALRWRGIGSGYLAVPIFSAIYLGPSVLAAKAGGLPAVFGMTIFAGLIEIAVARVLPYVRALFPPAVSGFTVLIVGLELGLVGMDQALGVEVYGTPQFPYYVGVALLTLAVCVGLSIWARGVARLICSLVGLAAGFATALALGLVPAAELQAFADAPLLGLPGLGHLDYGFDAHLAPVFAAAAVAAVLRTIGVVTTCEKINDAAWKRPDLGPIRGGVAADGAGCLFGGLLGTPGMSVGPSLVGVSQATGATSRYVAFSCAAILALVAFVPKFAALVLAIPLPVAGGMLIFTSVLMIAGGIQIMASRNIDTRMTFVIGVALLMGLCPKAFPAFFAELPQALQGFATSSLALGVSTAVGLNLLFRLGIRRRDAILLETTVSSRPALVEFIQGRGKQWKIDADIVGRATSSIEETFSRLMEARLAEGPVTAGVTYNELDLVIELKYQGQVMALPEGRASKRNFHEESSFSFGLPLYLNGVFADRIAIASNGEQVKMKLYFAT